jgi:hypothetical protein
VYSAQSRLVARLLRLTEAGTPVAVAFARQAPDQRIDIVRRVWNAQMHETERIVDTLERAA